jgi:signal transduction histidine kinase
MTPYSLRRRLVALMVGALVVALGAIGLFLYLGVRDAVWQQHDDSLLARAHALSALAERDDEGYEFEAPALGTSYVELWLPDGRRLHGGPSLHLDSHLGRTQFVDLQLPDGRQGRAIVLRFMPRTEVGPADEVGVSDEVTLVLAEGVEDVSRAMASIRNLFLLVSALAMAAVAGIVWWLAGSALRTLGRLALSIERIDDKSLERRLPVDGQPAELVAPVHKLNELLERLESSFARERQFTADVSHELRTPLAGLRTVLEVTSLADRTTTEYKAALADAHAIVLQLGALVENLLMLARLDAGQLAVARTEVNVRKLVDECWKPHAALAASRSLTFSNKVPDSSASLDREKLRVIVSNLLANAAEYTETGGWIEVGTDGSLLAVTNCGPALPETARIFDRLWRGDASRTGTGVHCGIGLALARSLAEHMSLTLTAENLPGGGVRFALSSRRGGGGDQEVRLRSVLGS